MLAVVGRIKLLLSGVFRPAAVVAPGDDRRAVILAAALFNLDGEAIVVLWMFWTLVGGNDRNDGDGAYRMVALVAIGSRDRLMPPRKGAGDLVMAVGVGLRMATTDAPMLDPLELLRLAGARVVVLLVDGGKNVVDGTVADRVCPLPELGFL